MPATFMWTVPHELPSIEAANCVASDILSVLQMDREICALRVVDHHGGRWTFEFIRKGFQFNGTITTGHAVINCFGSYPKSGMCVCRGTSTLVKAAIQKLAADLMTNRAA